MSARKIVVGLDGSPSSAAALAWARREARLRDVPLDVVLVFEPLSYGSIRGYPFPSQEVEQAARANAQRVLDDAEIDDVQVERHLIRAGDAATALIERSHQADLLVVGSRGHGGFAGLLLGSVSQKCVQHAACPVVVVRTQRDDGARG